MFIYLIFLLILFFLYLILHQTFFIKKNADKYEPYNAYQFNSAYNFGSITGNLYGLNGFSKLGYSIFSNKIVEGNKNNSDSDSGSGSGSGGDPSTQDLENQIQDLSMNVYQIGNQINQLAQQQNAPSQLPSTPPKITGTS